MNSALALLILKTKMGPADIRFLLACLNVKPPSQGTLIKVLSTASKIAKAENEKSMIENQEYVNKVQRLKGQGYEVDLKTDTSYNNRMEAGTMFITPVAECCTSRKLVVTLNMYQKRQM
jgi:hypothetical protein